MRRHMVLQATLVTSLIFGLQVPAARADLTLTPAGSLAGFSLSTFATGFPNTSNIGPLGIAFPGTGVLVSDFPGNVRVFPSDIDGQNAAAIIAGQNYSQANAVGLAQVGSHLYMAQQGNGQVVEVNPNGTLNQVIVTGTPLATGIIANPANGHLFVSTIQANQIFDVDPIAKTKTLFVNANADGLSIDGTGSVLYAALSNGHIVGFSTSTKLPVFDSGFIPGGLDGTALGTGSLLGNIFGLTNGGTVVEVNLTTLGLTTLATGGSRGDFVSVDPNNNTLLLTQSSTIVRLIAPAGGGFDGGPGGPAVPEPTTWLLLASGLAGAFAFRQRKRP